MELIIAEKPSAAKKIAEALADKKPVKKSVKTVSYYELLHNKKKLVVGSAVGHLFTLAEKAEKDNEQTNWQTIVHHRHLDVADRRLRRASDDGRSHERAYNCSYERAISNGRH